MVRDLSGYVTQTPVYVNSVVLIPFPAIECRENT